MSTIREVLPDEVEMFAVIFAEEFWKEGGFTGEFNLKWFANRYSDAIESGERFMIGLFNDANQPIAVIGGSKAVCIFTGHFQIIENFFYALPEARGHGAIRLMAAFEAKARSMGADRVWMIHLAHLEPERMKKWYERIGYKLKEHLYEKELKP